MVRPAQTPQDLAQAFAIRHQVFVQEQGVAAELEADSHDGQAIHWLAFAPDVVEAVATARLVGYSATQGKVGRVAVLPPWRGTGVGRQLMLAIHEWAGQAHIPQLILDAQLPVIPFYEKLGYQAQGDVFVDCGILHQRMWLQLD